MSAITIIIPGPDEASRLSRLYALQILDTEPEELFDSLASAAACACGVKTALLNLIDQDRLWSKAASSGTDRYEFPRDHSICRHALTRTDILEIEDLQLDQRFADNPLVDCPNGLRFYAGAPLRLADGSFVGTLCVFDTTPRKLTPMQRQALGYLATAAARALEARQISIDAVTTSHSAQSRIDRLYSATPAILQTTDAQAVLTHVSDHWLAEFGYEREAVIGQPFSAFVADGSPSVNASSPEEHTIRLRCSDGRLLHMKISSVTDLDGSGMAVNTMTVMDNITASLATQAALAHSRSFLERTGSVGGVGGWEYEIGSLYVTWSDRVCVLHDREPGYHPTLEEGLNHYTPASRRLLDEALRQAIADAQPWDLELSLVSATGRPFWARVAGTVDVLDGVPVRISGALQDISSRKLLESQLAETRYLLENTLESIADAVITTNVESAIEWMNPIAEQLTGWSRQDATGMPIGIVMPVSNHHQFSPDNPVDRAVLRCIQGHGAETLANDETLYHYGSNIEVAIQASIAPIRRTEGGVLGTVVVFRDVSKQRRQQKEMLHYATHDALTGLLNRAGFASALEGLLEEVRGDITRSHTLLYVDLDRFKIVNDSCGHSVGDTLLQEFATLLKGTLRANDIIARLGGDEFSLVLRDCREEQAIDVAEHIRLQADRHRFFHEDSSYRVGVSIGLVPVDSRWSSLKLLLDAGDMTCYAAKEAGRNCIQLWSDTNQATSDHRLSTQWVARLERALEEDRFELFGQRIEPAAGPGTGLSCEVLLRMREPDGSLILPGAFIVAAERFHMAPLLDRWVLHNVIDRLNIHAITGSEVEVESISVNLSGQSLADRAFGIDICNWIRAAEFDVRKLCLEITETSAIARFGDAKRLVDEVRSLGVKVALDDFGAGASSFGYLKNLTVDFLKIDGQFVKSLPNDNLDLATIRCFRDIAKSIGLRTVAEFVERKEQRDSLLELGIDMVQGYLIHRPEPLANLLPLPAPSYGVVLSSRV